MNFAHYYNILQQIEKPTFVFDRFENEEVIETSIGKLHIYLIENEKNTTIMRRLFCILVEKIHQCHEHNQEKDNNFVKFYDTNNFYLTYCNIALTNENFIRTTELVKEINNFDFHQLLNLNQKLKRNDDYEFEFGIWDIARKSHKNCYFNITTTEKDYFTLEIIAVIHKVIA